MRFERIRDVVQAGFGKLSPWPGKVAGGHWGSGVEGQTATLAKLF
jgi:hypothetical protein